MIGGAVYFCAAVMPGGTCVAPWRALATIKLTRQDSCGTAQVAEACKDWLRVDGWRALSWGACQNMVAPADQPRRDDCAEFAARFATSQNKLLTDKYLGNQTSDYKSDEYVRARVIDRGGGGASAHRSSYYNNR